MVDKGAEKDGEKECISKEMGRKRDERLDIGGGSRRSQGEVVLMGGGEIRDDGFPFCIFSSLLFVCCC